MIFLLISNIYSATFIILNFYLMCLGVLKAVEKDEKQAKNVMRTSHSLRTFGLYAVVAVGVLVPVFNVAAIIIPLFFPRIAILIRPLINKKSEKEEG